jgi:hypothetical protein
MIKGKSMTINIQRNKILKICKDCEFVSTNGRARNKYICTKWMVYIYKAYKCEKLTSVRGSQ